MPDRAVERKIGNHQQTAADIGGRTGHFAVLILKNTQPCQFFSAFCDIAFGILDADADKDEQSDADFACNSAVHSTARALYALNDGPHRPARVHVADVGQFFERADDVLQMLYAAALQADNQQHAVTVLPGRDRIERDLQIGKANGDVGNNLGRIPGVNMQHGFKIAVILAVRLLCPRGDDPAVLILGLTQPGNGVGTIIFMDGNTEALCNKADDRITRQRVTALGEFDVAAFESVKDNRLRAGPRPYGLAGPSFRAAWRRPQKD